MLHLQGVCKMNESSYLAAGAAIPKTYVTQGKDARRTHEKHIQVLLQQVGASLMQSLVIDEYL